MGHAFHEGLPGYVVGQLLVDHCNECEARAMSVDCGIGALDPARFALAWDRAGVLRRSGLPSCSQAEFGMLAVLGAVQVQLGLSSGMLATLAGTS